MAKPKVGLIILNWNGKKDTLECLETVKKTKNPSFKLITYVIDNASKDDSVSSFQKKYPRINLIQNSQNLGFSGGNNTGISQAISDGCDYVCLLNNDTTVHTNTFQNLFMQAKENNFDLSSPKIYFYPGREFHYDSYKPSERGKIIWYAGGYIDWNNVIPSHIGVDEYDHGQYDQPKITDFATGCCLLITKQVIQKIGLLDESYTAYFEDNDYCQKAIRAGFSVGYCPKSYLWHKNAGSTGGSGSAQQTQLVDSSRMNFGLKYAPLRAKLALLKQKYLSNSIKR